MGAVAGDRVRVQGLCFIGALPSGTFSLTLLPTVVATTLKNANASLVYSFLYKTVEVGSGLPLARWSVCPPLSGSIFPKTLCLTSLGVLPSKPHHSVFLLPAVGPCLPIGHGPRGSPRGCNCTDLSQSDLASNPSFPCFLAV